MEKTILNFDKICRICFEQCTKISVFEMDISEKLMECAKIEVWPNDGLPDKICLNCLVNLQISFKFRKQCEQSDVKLRLKLASYVQQQRDVCSQHTDDSDYEFIIEDDSEDDNNNAPIDDCKITNEVRIPLQTLSETNTIKPVSVKDEINKQNIVKAANSSKEVNATDSLKQIKSKKCEPETNEIEKKHKLHSELIIKEEREEELNKNEDTTKKQFQCEKCKKTFSTKDNLTQHSQTHAALLYICDRCQKSDGQQYSLTKHNKLHKLHKCEQCELSFNSKGNLKEHENIHADYRPFKCEKCEKSFRRKTHLKEHDKLHTGLKPFSCDKCDQRFRQEKDLMRHMSKHTGIRPFICHNCEKSFFQKEDLRKHLRIHNCFTQTPIDDCKITNEVRIPLQTLSETNTIKPVSVKDEINEQNIVKAANSSKEVNATDSLNQIKSKKCEPETNEIEKKHKLHSELIIKEEREEELNKNEDTTKKQFQCEKCKKTFSTKDNLTQHSQTHAALLYIRDRCQKSDGQQYSLTKHNKLHKLHKCEQCELSFNSKGNLKEHENIHADYRPFKCEKCEKSFRRKTHLKEHDKLHTGLKPFSCDKCDQRFRQEKDLMRHMSKHTGIRPFICHNCEKSFFQKEDLRKHLRIHNRVKN